MKVELIPALEIPVPPESRKKAGSRPAKSFAQNPDAWDKFQQKQLAAAGFNDYSRIIRGKNFVYVDEWTLVDLKNLILTHLMPNDVLVVVEKSCAFFGGYILIIDDVPVMVPQCCSTLADITSWQDLLNPEFTSGPFCTEGHPCPTAVKEGNKLLITCEDEWESFDQPTQQSIIVEVDKLAVAVEQASWTIQKLCAKVDLLSAEFGVPMLSNYLIFAKS